MSFQPPSSAWSNRGHFSIPSYFATQTLSKLREQCLLSSPKEASKISQMFQAAIQDFSSSFSKNEKERGEGGGINLIIELSSYKSLQKWALSDPLIGEHKKMLIRVLDCCSHLWEHLEEIKKNEFSKFLGEPSADLFLSIYIKSNREEVYSFISKYKDHPSIRQAVQLEFGESSSGGVKALLHLSQKSENCSWAKTYLLKNLSENKNGLLFQTIINELNTQSEYCTDFLETFYEWLGEGHPAAIQLLIVFFCSKKIELIPAILEYIFQKAIEGDEKLQTYIIVLMGMDQKNIVAHFYTEAISQNSIMDLKNRSQIWFINGMRWGNLIKQKIDLIEEKLGSKYRLFMTLTKEIESYFLMHLFFLDPTAPFPSSIPPNRPEFFPEVEGILMGCQSVELDGFEAVDSFIKYISKVATDLLPEGIKVYSSSVNEQFGDHVETISCNLNRWVRDFVHLGPNGERKIANFIFDESMALKFLEDEKKKRQAPHEYLYAYQGRAIKGLYMLDIANLHWDYFQDECRSLHFLWTYLEGGNCKFGESKEGVPFVLIGKDSVELNRALISSEIKFGRYCLVGEEFVIDPQKECSAELVPEDLVSYEFLKKVFSRDYGIKPENIHFVEQPNTFHIDMGLCFAGNKKVLVNNSVQALEISLNSFKSSLSAKAKKFVKEEEIRVTELRASANISKILEDQTEQDLIEQGFEVVRVAGIFSNPYFAGPEGLTNFFNHVSMKTKNETPRRIIYALGSPRELEGLFKKMIEDHFSEEEIDLFFTDYEFALESLRSGGGVHCTMQTFIENWSKRGGQGGGAAL